MVASNRLVTVSSTLVIVFALSGCGVDEKQAEAQAKREENAIAVVLEAETQHKLQVHPVCFPSWDGKPMWCHAELYNADGIKFDLAEAIALRDTLRLKYNSLSGSITTPKDATDFVSENISWTCELMGETATPTQRMAGCKAIARY